jgi:hypothetical protein
VGSKELGPHWRDRNLNSGTYQGEAMLGLVQFDLRTLAPGSQVLFGALELTGRNARYLKPEGEWTLEILDSEAATNWDEVSYDQIRQVKPAATLDEPLKQQGLGAGVTNRFVLAEAELKSIQEQLATGTITLRLRGPTEGEDNLFTWDAGPGPSEPILSLVVIPAPFAVITNTPTPFDVFTAATQVYQQTAVARKFGTATPLPRSIVTATPYSGPTPFVITNTPTPYSETMVAYQAALATAVAVTTGTFTPLPSNWVTATPFPLIIPLQNLTAVPSPTPRPPGLSARELAQRPLPPGLFDKILFQEGPRSSPNIWVMDPSGKVQGLLTDREVFNIAKARDAFSPTRNLEAYQAPDLAGVLQLWFKDWNYPEALPQQVSYVKGADVVFGPAWSPDGTRIAYTRGALSKQEIWVYTLEPRNWKQITFSTGGWWWNQFPSWSPDGSRIVYSSDRDHDATFSEIWVMNADGTGARNLGNGVWDAYNPVWVKWQR